MTRNAFLIALVALGAAFGQQAATKQEPKSKKLTRVEFDKLLTSPGQVLVIDVRRPDELTANGGFPVYLSIQAKDLEQQLEWIPKGRTIVTVSNHAARSGRAADLLTAKGYKVAGLLGAQTYEEQGGKLTKIEVPPPRTGAPTSTPTAAATTPAAPASK